MVAVSGGVRMAGKLDAIKKRLRSARVVRAGFTEQAKYPDGTPVAVAAASTNFGAPAKGVPPRPFFSDTVREKRPVWGPKLGELLKKSGLDASVALELMGGVMAGDIAQQIVEGNYLANSEVTNLLKQRFPTRDGMTFADVIQAWEDVEKGESAPAGKPLVWSGIMLQSLQGPGAYEVE